MFLNVGKVKGLIFTPEEADVEVFDGLVQADSHTSEGHLSLKSGYQAVIHCSDSFLTRDGTQRAGNTPILEG